MTAKIVPDLKDFLDKSSGETRVIMLCGMAGSGKSTLAKTLAEKHDCHRLSIDETIYQDFGLYGQDYDASEYEAISNVAKDKLTLKFRQLIRSRQKIVLDRSFWSLQDRKICYKLLEEEGVQHYKLVYLTASEEFLWNRIQVRKSEPLNANNAAEISRDTFERYWEGFEAPSEDEKPTVVDVEILKSHADGDIDDEHKKSASLTST